MGESVTTRTKTASKPNSIVRQLNTAKTRKKLKQSNSPIAIEFDPSVLPILTKDTVVLLHHFLNFLQRKSNWIVGDAYKIEVRGSVDLEDNTSQIIVRLWLPEASQQMVEQDYRRLCSNSSAWLETLNGEQRQLFTQQLSFQVRSRRDA